MFKTALLAVGMMAASFSASAAQTFKTEDEKILYTLGVMLGKNIGSLNVNKSELEVIKKGITDGATGAKPLVPVDEYRAKIDGLQRARVAKQAEGEKKKAEPFLANAAAEKGAVKTPSGLIYTELKAGTGPSPKESDTVRVHYRGTLIDGTEFDSSYKRNEPAEFKLGGVIPCWTEGLQKMKVGGKAKLVCPSSIAYQDQGRPPTIPGGATLVFEVELLDIPGAQK
jgi:FKBP-type peptidyl-prolyl cis-trans isomerase FkpA